jgi:hypothetical protein
MCTRYQPFLVILASLGLAGCGLTNPKISEVLDADYPGDPTVQRPRISATAQIEFEIKKKVYCELKRAASYVASYSVTERGESRSFIPPEWIAQVALSLQVDESVSMNPGLSWTQLLPNAVKVFGVQNSVPVSQSFTFGLGATASSTASRIDKFNPQYRISYLLKPETKDSVCKPENDPFKGIGWVTPSSSPFLIESDLGIEDWLLGAMFVNNALKSDVTPINGSTAPRKSDAKASGSGEPGAGATSKADTITYEIKFIIVSNASVTPTWKLIRVSANTGSGSFFGIGRTRTHDLIITIGPDTTATSNAHFSSQVSSGIATSIRALNPGGM